MFSILKREFRSYFLSPLAYVLFGIFMLVFAISFLDVFLESRTAFTFAGKLSFMGIMLMFTLPVLTMRLFTEEKKSGTEVLLITSPVKITGIVFGKYLSALLVFLTMTALTLIFPLIIRIFGNVYLAEMLGSYAGFILMGATFISFGMFASAVTENQVVAAVIGFFGLIALWMLGAYSVLFPGLLGKAAKWVSPIERFAQFTQGVIRLEDVVFYLCFTGAFIAITIIIIEKRRWSQG